MYKIFKCTCNILANRKDGITNKIMKWTEKKIRKQEKESQNEQEIHEIKKQHLLQMNNIEIEAVSIENQVGENPDFASLIREFADKKTRKIRF